MAEARSRPAWASVKAAGPCAGKLPMRPVRGPADELVAERAVVRRLDRARPRRRGLIVPPGLFQQVGVRRVQWPVGVELSRAEDWLEHRESGERTISHPDR